MRRLVVFGCVIVATMCESVAAAEPDGPAADSPSTATAPELVKTTPAGPRSPTPDRTNDRNRPTPLEVDYAQYGLGLGGELNLSQGPICPAKAATPCILGSGGGLAIRGGYRPSGPWYFGGAYQFSKLDSNNLFRLGIFQQLRGEMRYFIDLGSRVTPYVEWGLGGAIYGNEWGADTAGALALAGGGIEFEITRFAVIGLQLAYEPVLLAGYTDTTGQRRDTGITQFLRMELRVELRTELGRE